MTTTAREPQPSPPPSPRRLTIDLDADEIRRSALIAKKNGKDCRVEFQVSMIDAWGVLFGEQPDGPIREQMDHPEILLRLVEQPTGGRVDS